MAAFQSSGICRVGLGFFLFLFIYASRGGPLDSWQTEQPTPIYKVLYFKGRFYADGVAFSSVDGRHWEKGPLRGPYPVGVLTRTEDKLVIPRLNALSMTSDGQKLETLQLPPWLTFDDLAYGNGRFAGVLQRASQGPFS